MTDGGMFDSLRYPQHRRLWLSGLVVFFATTSQVIARGWLARDLTGTNAGLGGVLLGFGVAMLIATPLGGVAADRLPKRTVLLTAQILFVLSSGSIGLAAQFDVAEYWMLVAASAVQACAFACYGPGRVAFISELLPPETVPNALVIAQMSAEAMRVIGPVLAGILIASAEWGLAAVFEGGAVLCAIAGLLTLTLPPGLPNANRPVRSPFADLVDGVSYVRRNRDLTLLVFTSLAIVITCYPYNAFLPTLAEDVFGVGSGGYGVMSAAGAIGAVGAGFFAARRRGRNAWKVSAIAGGILGTALVVLGSSPSYVMAVAALAVMGGASLTFQTTINSLVLGRSYLEYHGRIQSLLMLGFSGFGIAALPLGALADAIGLRVTLSMMGATALVVALLFTRASVRYRAADVVYDLG